MKRGFILAVLLISMVSLSMAACPVAKNDLSYRTQCGQTLDVPAPGILANDLKDADKTLSVVDPESITISQGTLEVKEDGSFVYKAPANVPASMYVYFYYRATDGTCVSNQATARILLSCTCHGGAPDVNVCPGTMITPEFLISKGAGCFGCRDATPQFDLSQIPAEPVAGQCYEYTVSCPSCALAKGKVCFRDCDDDNACTTDTCVDGECVNTPIVCDDGNACTADTCDPATGCVYTPIVCDDDSECTADTCDPATGCVYTPIVCDDDSECTADTCDPATGCVYTPIT
jgi:hypothetical protein